MLVSRKHHRNTALAEFFGKFFGTFSGLCALFKERFGVSVVSRSVHAYHNSRFYGVTLSLKGVLKLLLGVW